MPAILGISAFYHDSAAALIVGGRIVAAAQEERFTRKKHDPGFPAQAIDYCLREAAIDGNALDYVAYYEKPLVKFERLMETYLAFAPSGFGSFRQAMPVWLKEKLFMRRALKTNLPPTRAKLIFLDHHESHAASAFFPSPFDEAAILTLDGVGEWSTTVLAHGKSNRIQLLEHLSFPHSLGLLYSAFTYYCGFKVNSGEYKLMGLAPYGRPIYENLIRRHLIDIKEDGSFWMDMRYFNYCQGLTMTNRRFDGLFGGKPRSPESELTQRHMDLAASIQAVAETIILRLAQTLYERTKSANVVLAGGVALNCVANGRLAREGPFKNLWIQPAAGDAGGALGAAMFVWHQLLEKPRRAEAGDSQKGSFLGCRESSADIERLLTSRGIPCEKHKSERELLSRVASLLSDRKVVGWFQGRMEFGPRALGARSILGDPRAPDMQAKMNVKIKFRESFRPFAPSVLQERAGEWFELGPETTESGYMLLVAPVRREKRVPISEADRQSMQSDPDLRKRVNVIRSKIPAVTHVDYSARLQTVDEARNPRFYRLLREFESITGCPVLVNTSFNVRGEPIVRTAAEALQCFLATDMDALVLEDYVILKDTLTNGVGEQERQRHLHQFQLD